MSSAARRLRLRQPPQDLSEHVLHLIQAGFDPVEASIVLCQLALYLDESAVDLDKSAVDLDKSAVDLTEAAVDLGESAVDLGESAVDLTEAGVMRGHALEHYRRCIADRADVFPQRADLSLSIGHGVTVTAGYDI
jgi:hypothetical protein